MFLLVQALLGQSSFGHDATSLYPLDWSEGPTFCTYATCNPRNPTSITRSTLERSCGA